MNIRAFLDDINNSIEFLTERYGIPIEEIEVDHCFSYDNSESFSSFVSYDEGKYTLVLNLPQGSVG